VTESQANANSAQSQTAIEAARKEIARQRRLIDQTITAHSLLRDRYLRRATVMTCGLLAASVLATAFAFASGEPRVTILGVSAQRATWLGWFAVVTFTVTLIDLVLDWRGSKRKHEAAVRQLAVLKTEYRTPPEPGTEVEQRDRLSERYQTVMDAIPNLPERDFLRLKASHLRKVEVSRILSAHAGMTVRQARRELASRLKSES
jgi:hypothetical protein